MSKRVWKLQDFIAHSGHVNCARLGEKSGQVLATGGEDKRVNIWKVGKPNAIVSLTGHNSSVGCLVFDKQEEVLVVGCGGGALQVWNLEYRKMAGTLAGHRTSCGAVECHPYGEFFASGSADTNLKIWDLRQKSCIQTYKGHTGTITSIKFSPHGRWVATGGQDCLVKLWDLTAGKIMRDLDMHRGPITSIAFHPKEYLLASGSADRTMKLSSLETFQPLGSTDPGTSPVSAVKFYVEEQAVVSASADSLRIYPVDGIGAGMVPSDVVEVDWKGLQDLRLIPAEEKLLAVSTEAQQLGIWVADLQRRAASEVTVPGAKGAGYARLHNRGAPPAAAGRLPTAHPQAQQPPRRQPRHPEEAAQLVADESPPWEESGGVDYSGVGAAGPAGGQAPEPESEPERRLGGGGGLGGSPHHEAAAPATTAAHHADQRHQPQPAGGERLSSSPTPSGSGRGAFAGDFGQQVAGSPHAAGAHRGAPSPATAVPPREGPRPQRRSASSPEISTELLAKLASPEEHTKMMGVLQRRQERVQRLKDLWAKGDINAVPGLLNGPQDHAIFCDFTRAIMRQNLEQALTLDSCMVLLPILQDVLGSQYEDFQTTALTFVEVLLHKFRGLIAETRQSCSRIPERQLDLPREERLRKCDACHERFREIHRLVPEGRFSGFQATLHHFLQSC